MPGPGNWISIGKIRGLRVTEWLRASDFARGWDSDFAGEVNASLYLLRLGLKFGQLVVYSGHIARSILPP
jgi:hypothetical protein